MLTHLAAAKPHILQIATYAFFGAIAALGELGSFWELTQNGFTYMVSALLSTFVGLTINYVLQRKFTFKNKHKRKHAQYALFLALAAIGIAINFAVTLACVELLAIAPLAAKCLGLLAAFAYNYSVNKKITFGRLT